MVSDPLKKEILCEKTTLFFIFFFCFQRSSHKEALAPLNPIFFHEMVQRKCKVLEGPYLKGLKKRIGSKKFFPRCNPLLEVLATWKMPKDSNHFSLGKKKFQVTLKHEN